MSWNSYYRGDGIAREVAFASAPPWRHFPRRSIGAVFKPPKGLTDAVNAALTLRRPLLVSGPPGSGKSTLIESVAEELRLGSVLRWHITSRSTLLDALYRYDVLGRIHERQISAKGEADIAPFLRLGPLGTALMPSSRPRALLIDEIDKSDLDLPGDLLEVLERGEFEIVELSRHEQPEVSVRSWDSDERHVIRRGLVQCAEFPFIVMTSNGERDFPAAFLRRCVRYQMPPPDVETVASVVQAHFGLRPKDDPQIAGLVEDFVARLRGGEVLALDQLLNAVFVLTGERISPEVRPEEVVDLLMQELGRA